METTLEQFVQMTAMAQGDNFQQMYAHFNISEDEWQAIALEWMGKIGNNLELGQKFQTMMVAEIERLRTST